MIQQGTMLVFCSLVFGGLVELSKAQTDPEPPNPVQLGDVESHGDSDNPYLFFKPLAPQFSDYWLGAGPQTLQSSFPYPMPPLPLAYNIYPAWGDEHGDAIGSAFSTDPLFWKGAYQGEGNPWEFYTIDYTPNDGVDNPLNWHNFYQWMVGYTGSGPAYPPVWSENQTDFTGWVDLYAPYLSRAFFDDFSGFESDSGLKVSSNFGRYGFPRVGSPQHVDLPPTYPPQSLDVWSSTSPLVPASGGHAAGMYTTRQTVGGNLDLITGEPLLAETDLELRFGSAVFRRIRTYSERPEHGIKVDNWMQFSEEVESGSRGWHGSGWMSSEMPLFFFDSSQAGTITTGGENEIGPVCYFVPDAHHSIPFVQQDRSTTGANVPPDYVAPDWFDAMLLYNKEACEWGDTDPDKDGDQLGWIVPPAEMKVYLHDRSVIYTIKMYYEDVDPVQHQRPRIDEYGAHQLDPEPENKIYSGVPYYGLVNSIKDKSGNEIRVNYVSAEKHKPYEDTSLLATRKVNLIPPGQDEDQDDSDDLDVIPVLQKGWYKGMVDNVKLYPAGSSEAKWSIFYTYRTFYSERDRSETFLHSSNSDVVEEFINYWDYKSHPPALHSLLVYERDVNESEIASDRELILPCDSRTYGPAEHVVEGDAPPAFVDIKVDFSSTDSDGDGDMNVVRVFGEPATGSHNNLFDHQDAAIGPTGRGGEAIEVLPEDWMHQLRFSYADPAYYGDYEVQVDGEDPVFVDNGRYSPTVDLTLRSCGPVDIDDDYWVRQTTRAAYLLKVAKKSRAELSTSEMQDLPENYWLYRYQDVVSPGADAPDAYPGGYYAHMYWNWGTLGVSLPRRLSHRYGPETVGRIYKNRPDFALDCTYNDFVNGMVYLDEDKYINDHVCNIVTPDPDPDDDGTFSNGDVDADYGGEFDFGEPGGPYPDPDGGSGNIQTSATHSLTEEEIHSLPIGLLADTIFYRWSQPYRLDPRMLSTVPEGGGDTGVPELIARPASWALYDGRYGGEPNASPFNVDLRDTYVGGSVSLACEDLLGLTITQADQLTTGFLPGGAGVYSVVGADGSTKWRRMYRFITAPDTPVDWRGSLYGITENPESNAQLGPEVIWDSGSYSDIHPGDDPSSIPNNVNATHAMYYYPFNFVATNWGIHIEDAKTVNITQSKPMWWVVVDEYDSIEEALSVNSSMAFPEADSADFIYDEYQTQTPWNNRRVVGMNSTGAVLSDRTWTNDEDETPSTDDPPAIMEAWSYDQYLRPILKFSRGWGAAAAIGAVIEEDIEISNGLVEVFEYDVPFAVNMGSPGHGAEDTIITLAPRTPLDKWIRKGCAPGNDVRISSIEYYDEPDAGSEGPQEWRAKLPKLETFYDLLGNQVGAIEHFYGHWSEDELPDDDSDGEDPENTQPPLRWKVRAGPEYKTHPNHDFFVRSVDGQWYNNKGQLVWQVSGSMVVPYPDDQGKMYISDGDEIFLNYFQYDEDGRMILKVEDIGIDASGVGFSESNLVFAGHASDQAYADGDSTIQPFWQQMDTIPSGTLFVGEDVPADDIDSSMLDAILAKIVLDQNGLIGDAMYRQAEAQPLNLVTFKDYNNFGQFKVVHPNGLRDITHYEVQSDYLRELRAMGVDYEDGAWSFAGQGLFDSDFEGQSFSEGIQATIASLEAGMWSGSPYDLEGGVFEDYRLEVIADIEPNYDTAGRLTSLTVADSTESAGPLKSAISYDGWGNALLEISPDRLIKRYKYDGLGRLHKTFVGSKDRNYIWRTATEEDTDDDLILTEKLYYGTSPTDAFLPSKKWMYRARSDEQYGTDWIEYSDDQHSSVINYEWGDSADNRASPGRVEHYGYDWRMRKVITKYEDFEVDNPEGVYREERTYLDNLNRVRFVAVYDGEALASAPDPDIAPGGSMCAASDFLGTGVADNLLSLAETVYNGASQVAEQRRYDPAGTGGYLVTHSFADHADRAVWASSSGGESTLNIYDAKGRVERSSVFSGDIQADYIEMTRSTNTYGPDGNIEEVRFIERIGEAAGPSQYSLDAAPHRMSVSYTWYDNAGRVVSTADMGSTEFDGVQYDRDIPSRPVNSLEQVAKIDDYFGTPAGSERNVLVGVNFPDSFFDSVTGEAIARVTCYWYDRLGKQNASLNIVSCSKDVVSEEVALVFTLARTELNRYGQKVLEHKYEYTGDGISYLHTDFTLLGGMEYTYEAEVFLEGQQDPSVLSTTQVRTITPLNTDPNIMTIVWDATETEIEVVDGDTEYTVSGSGRFIAKWGENDENLGERRTTILEYGAPVVQPDWDIPSYVLHPQPGPGVPFPIDSNDWGHLGISNRPDLIKAVHLPNPSYGGTGDGLGYSMFFFYYPDGLPAIRVDSRGIGIQYIYDADGNLIRLSSDDANMPLVADLGMIDDQLPSNAIEYTYDALSRLLNIKTGRDKINNSFRMDTESILEYDTLGNLVSEDQKRYADDGSLIAGGVVGYAWDTRLRLGSEPVDSSNNVNRLLSIMYPDRVGTHDGGAYSPRVVTLGYGETGSVSDQFSRVESLTSSGGPLGAELGHIATYRYDGLNRLGGVDLGDVPGEPTPTFVHTDDRQFDIFGRVIDRQVKSFDYDDVDSGNTHLLAMSSQFGYDLRGQRVFEHLSQMDHPTLGSRANVDSSSFGYDTLGRLISEDYGVLSSNGFDGIVRAQPNAPPMMTYTLDSLNRRVGQRDSGGALTVPGLEVWYDSNVNGLVDSGELTEQTHVIDERGGLTGIDDGSAVDAVGQDASGAITAINGRNVYHDWLGRPVLVMDSTDSNAVFSVNYDGFGRVAQRKAPWPNSNPDKVIQRIETYFYDGVRRIQEVFDDPKAATPPWPVEIPLGGGPFGGGSSGPEQRIEAEYIWSAASGQPFDTCHVQIDWWDREAWFIQDHSTGTVRAFTDANGEMVKQYRFDAYGNLRSQDTFPLAGSGGLFSGFRNRLGHQGLFAERVDSHTSASIFASNGEIWYQNRSRWYVPELGRFMTSDPNSTGIPTMSRLAMLGKVAVGAPGGSFESSSHYGDGWDTYTAYGGNPVMYQDPSGLTMGFLSSLNLRYNAARVTLAAYEVNAMVIAEFATGGFLIGGGALKGAGLLDDLLFNNFISRSVDDFVSGLKQWGKGKGGVRIYESTGGAFQAMFDFEDLTGQRLVISQADDLIGAVGRTADGGIARFHRSTHPSNPDVLTLDINEAGKRIKVRYIGE